MSHIFNLKKNTEKLEKLMSKITIIFTLHVYV